MDAAEMTGRLWAAPRARYKWEDVRMALDIDTTRAFRSYRQLAALVDAVIAATKDDEVDWIEWKVGQFLANKEDYAKLSRHILGMANRKPPDAARQVGGCGYIIIGASAGSCDGVSRIDPAVLDDGIQPYLGSEGPTWGLQWVDKQGRSVLVITVEPPQVGDRMFPLMKEYNGYYAGEIFVRRPGKTIRALPGDIRALEDRLAAGERTVDLKVRPAASDGIAAVHAFGQVGPIIDRWIEYRRTELIPESMRETPPPPDPLTEARNRGFRMASNLDLLATSYAGSFWQSSMKPDKRTKKQYINEVEEYLEKCLTHYRTVAFLRHIKSSGSRVRVNLVNGSERIYKDVSVRVTIPGAAVYAVPDDKREPKPPQPPETLGTAPNTAFRGAC